MCYPCLCLHYSLFQKKCNFSPWIFPGAQGQGHVTWGHVKMMHNPRFTVYTLLQKKHNFRNVAFLLEKTVVFAGLKPKAVSSHLFG